MPFLEGFIGAIINIIGFVITLLGTISNLFLQLAVGLFNFVISSNFISLSFTNAGISPGQPGFNTFVSVGWELTRGLTNIIFVVAMIAIGLGTALRVGPLAEYHFKKALPILIIIALLINFTPVICGLMIDASNIVMNYFFQHGFGGGNVFLSNITTIWGSFSLEEFWNPARATERLMSAITLNFFNIVAALVFFLFSFLFIARYIALWTLVILSPFAFACYVLPQTRKVFQDWWKQFFNWTIIGVVAGFWLYLGSQMIQLANKGGFVGKLPEGQVAGLGLFNLLLPWGICIVFLFLGLFASLVSGAMFAGTAIGWGKRAGVAVGRFAGRQTAGRYLAWEKTKGEKSWLKRLEGAKFGLPESREDWKKAPLWKKALGAVTAVPAYPARWGLRVGVRGALRYGAEQPAFIDKEAKKWEGYAKADLDDAVVRAHQLLPIEGDFSKMGAILGIARAKGAKGLSKFTPEEIVWEIKSLATNFPKALEDIVKNRPELIEGIIGEKDGKPIPDKEIKGIIEKTMVSKGNEDDDVKEYIKLGVSEAAALKAIYKKAVDAMENKDLETVDKKIMDNKDFREAVVRWKSPSFRRKMMEEWGSDVGEKLQSTAEEIDSTLEQIARTNPSFIKDPYGAGGAFLRHWKVGGRSINKQKANNIIELANIFKRKQSLLEYEKIKTFSINEEEIKKIEVELARATNDVVKKQLNESLKKFEADQKSVEREIGKDVELKKSFDRFKELNEEEKKIRKQF